MDERLIPGDTRASCHVVTNKSVAGMRHAHDGVIRLVRWATTPDWGPGVRRLTLSDRDHFTLLINHSTLSFLIGKSSLSATAPAAV